ncbi:MAG: ATP-binding protein [Hyphomicrobium sp.]
MAKVSPASMVGTAAFRLAALTVAAFMLVAAAILAVILWQTNRLVTEQVLREIRAEVAVLRDAATAGGSDGLRDAVAQRSLPPARGLYRLADREGRRLAGNLSRLPPELDPRLGGVFRYQPAEAGASGAESRLAAAVLEEIGATQLLVGRDIEEQRGFAESIRRSFLWGFGLLSVAALVGALAAGRRMLDRIGTISETSRSIMAGDLSRRMPLSGSGDEFDDLSRSLNAMLERIEQLMGSLREVSDNIAHDLKTPLNRLRNRAEAALRDERGGDAYREGLERTIEEADGLISTFNALLLIARLEAGAADETESEFDLGTLVRDCVELYEPVAEEAGLSLTLTAGKSPMLVANRHLVGQAVANLIDNAIKYGRPLDGRPAASAVNAIDVSVAGRGAEAEISVADRGPGIGPKDRERVLKRFVRLEESRTRPGTGLGLSLVAAVARLHGGSIRLEDNAPGLRVVLTLPVRARRTEPATIRT